MSHSPEPWRCHPERQGDYGHAIYSDDGVCVADVVEHYHSINDEANAKRIVACVNYCRGIPTEQLKQPSPPQIVPQGAVRPALQLEGVIRDTMSLTPRPETPNP